MQRLKSLARTLWLVPGVMILSASSAMAVVLPCNHNPTGGGGPNVPEISPEAIGSALVILVAGVLILMARRTNKPANQPS